MSKAPVMLITGTRKGIGRHLADHYATQGFRVIGCSRGESDLERPNYRHHAVDVACESSVQRLFQAIRRDHGSLDVLINNAGIASMNHALLTPIDTVRIIFETNVVACFHLCREGAKLMRKSGRGRIVTTGIGRRR